MPSFNKLVISAALGASLLLAACGGSSQKSTSSSQAANSSPPASQPSSNSNSNSNSGGTLTIGTAKASVGTYLTGASGRALYIWVADSKGKSSCAGACATAWPPLTASTMPKVTGGVAAADVSLISRSDGTKQVAYQGRPLYYYVGDTESGTTNGQGSNQFGAKWWLISPSGGQVTGSSTAAPSASGASVGGGASKGSSGGASGGGSSEGSSGGASGSGSASEGSSGSSSGSSWG